VRLGCALIRSFEYSLVQFSISLKSIDPTFFSVLKLATLSDFVRTTCLKLWFHASIFYIFIEATDIFTP
jgi:hypothetical protein